jgi:hypothetical protein
MSTSLDEVVDRVGVGSIDDRIKKKRLARNNLHIVHHLYVIPGNYNTVQYSVGIFSIWYKTYITVQCSVGIINIRYKNMLVY